MPVFALRDTTVTIQDGNVSPNTCIVKFGDGNFTYERQRNMEYKLNRGVVDSVRQGDDIPMTVSFDGRWEYITSDSGASTPTMEEALDRTGVAASWKSTESDPCMPYAVDLVVEYDPGCSGAGAPNRPVETIKLPKFRWESLNHDGKNATVACRGRCNAVAPVITRST